MKVRKQDEAKEIIRTIIGTVTCHIKNKKEHITEYLNGNAKEHSPEQVVGILRNYFQELEVLENEKKIVQHYSYARIDEIDQIIKQNMRKVFPSKPKKKE